MSNNKKRKRPRPTPSSYRAPAAQPPARRGLLDGILAPRPAGASPMPRLRSTVARGAVTALSIRWLVIAIPIVVLALWALFTAFGFEGPFSAMNVTFALPPITTSADPQIAGKTFRAAIGATGIGATATGLGAIIGLLLFHAAVNAFVATLSVEQLRTGSVSSWALRRAGRVIRTTAAVGFMSLGLLIVGNLIAAVLGGIGVVFGLVGSMVLGIYLFGFAPAIAADEERRLTDVLTRSVRAARMPGSANLWLAIIYVLISLVTLVAPLPGSTIGVTPSVTAWAVILVVNVGHVIMQSTLAYRYLVVAPEVPEQPAPRPPRAPRS
jgi:hypothetical protein